MMDRCVAGLANVTPFRGVSADVGTAFEMGYLFGRGCPVWGYTSHAADYAVRVGANDGAGVVDDGELLVEAFGLADNLMLEGPMLRRERAIVRVSESGRVPQPRSMRSKSWCGSRPPSSTHDGRGAVVTRRYVIVGVLTVVIVVGAIVISSACDDDDGDRASVGTPDPTAATTASPTSTTTAAATATTRGACGNGNAVTFVFAGDVKFPEVWDTEDGPPPNAPPLAEQVGRPPPRARRDRAGAV